MNKCIYYRNNNIRREHTEAFTKDRKQNREKNKDLLFNMKN